MVLLYKDAGERDMETCNIAAESPEVTVENRSVWKQQFSHSLKQGGSAMCNTAEDQNKDTFTES